jgi:hypothetical protein
LDCCVSYESGAAATRVAREAIARLNAEFAGRIVLDAYFWEYEPFDFSKSFQEQIPNTATFDVVLCLLWSRLGSRLGASQRLPDGSPASSGTEYEITHALTGQKERNGLPELHVWINQTIPSFQPEPPEIHDERIGQWRALKRFIENWTKDSEDGSFVGSFTAYHTIADFQDLFETKLRKIAERRVALSPGTLAPPAGLLAVLCHDPTLPEDLVIAIHLEPHSTVDVGRRDADGALQRSRIHP